MHRRELLAGVGMVTTVSLAGCSNLTSSDTPDSESDPATFLPPEGDGWQIENQQSWDASQLHENADAGVTTRYSGPDDGSYQIVIVQWGDDPTDVGRETAQSTIDGDVRSIVRTGSVTLVATSINGSNVEQLIGRSETFNIRS